MPRYEDVVGQILSVLHAHLGSIDREPLQDWDVVLEKSARRIADDLINDWPYLGRNGTAELLWRQRHLHAILEAKIEDGVSTILKQLSEGFDRPIRACRFSESNADPDFFQLIIPGGRSQQAVDEGRLKASKELKRWLEDAVEITILDPFLFKCEKPAPDGVEPETHERNHADDLLAILGTGKLVNFFYRGNPDKDDGGPIKVSKGVADRIESKLSALSLKATFHVVEDLHDRVWMKRDAKAQWHARVIGTSRGGIGKRPTYIVDMNREDCSEYLSYVSQLKACAQIDHLRPIDFKKPSSTKKSNSGRPRSMRTAR